MKQQSFAIAVCRPLSWRAWLGWSDDTILAFIATALHENQLCGVAKRAGNPRAGVPFHAEELSGFELLQMQADDAITPFVTKLAVSAAGDDPIDVAYWSRARPDAPTLADACRKDIDGYRGAARRQLPLAREVLNTYRTLPEQPHVTHTHTRCRTVTS